LDCVVEGDGSMASLREITKQIETLKLEDSKITELQGNNVRTPSLIKGQLYIAKTWKIIREESDNPWFVVRFVGSGVESRGERKLHDVNPRIKDMSSNDYYFFDHFTDGKNVEFNASMVEECLVIGENNTRVTFFEIIGVTEQIKAAKPEKEKIATRIPRVKKVDSESTPSKVKKGSKAGASSRGRKKANEKEVVESAEQENNLEMIEDLPHEEATESAEVPLNAEEEIISEEIHENDEIRTED
jgi:hypothetical protein